MRKTLTALLIWAGLAQGAWAQTIEDRLLAALETQGFVILEKGMTFFGRLRILAANDTTQREIVINPETGEILRDYTVLLALVDTNSDQQQSGKSPHSPDKKSPPKGSDPNIAAGKNDADGGVLSIEVAPQEQTPNIITESGNASGEVIFPPSPLGSP